MRMSKESKRGKEEKESLKLLKMKISALLVNPCFNEILTTLCFLYLHVILAILCFQSLQNDDVVEFALFFLISYHN